MRNLVILGCIALGVLSGKANADLVILDVPGATYYAPTGVSGNEVVGFYGNSPRTNGFLYSGGQFSTIAPPWAASVYAGGISGNSIVGSYISLTSSGQVRPAAIINSGEQGFLYDGKSYTTLNVPGAFSTHLNGISGNTVVGDDSVSGVQHGIVYQGGKFTNPRRPRRLWNDARRRERQQVRGHVLQLNGTTRVRVRREDLHHCKPAGRGWNRRYGHQRQSRRGYVHGRIRLPPQFRVRWPRLCSLQSTRRNGRMFSASAATKSWDSTRTRMGKRTVSSTLRPFLPPPSPPPLRNRPA